MSYNEVMPNSELSVILCIRVAFKVVVYSRYKVQRVNNVNGASQQKVYY